MWWHTVTHGRGSERENGEWVVLFTLPRNMVYPALLPLMRTPRLPVVDWTDAPRRFKRTGPFRRKTKSPFCPCAITFQAQSTPKHPTLPPRHLYSYAVPITPSFPTTPSNLGQEVMLLTCIPEVPGWKFYETRTILTDVTCFLSVIPCKCRYSISNWATITRSHIT